MSTIPSPLGPTECSMLYKIGVSKNRRQVLTSTLCNKYGIDIIVVPEKESKDFFPSNGKGILLDLVKGEPPKQWIQKQIDKVEEEEGLLIANVIRIYGQQGKDLIKKIAYEHGIVTGSGALRWVKSSRKTVTELYNLLDQYLLDGWPDQYSKKITISEKRIIICCHNCCVHLKNWQKAGVSSKDMCEISAAWVEGFCRAFSRTIEYKRKKSLAWGDPRCEEVFQEN